MSKKEIRECEKILKALSECFNPMICAQQIAILASQQFPSKFQEGGIVGNELKSNLIDLNTKEKILPENVLNDIKINKDGALTIRIKVNKKQFKLLKGLKKRLHKYLEKK